MNLKSLFSIFGRRSPQRYRLANAAYPGIHKDGLLSKFPDVEFPIRYLICKIGSGPQNIQVAGQNDIPFGVVQDSTDTGTSPTVIDLTLPLQVMVLSGCGYTGKVAINSTVNQGDLLIPDNNGYARTKPSSGLVVTYAIGRALQAGVAGDVIEYAPDVPTAGSPYVPIFAGVQAGTQNSANDTVSVSGLNASDTVLVTLAAQAGTETIVKAAAASGQVNITLSSNATAGTTKYNVVAFRTINT